MNEYYYLDNRSVPQGPYSLSELAAMMAAGRVNPTTLVACKGGASWEPLGSVLSREHIDAPEMVLSPGQVGNCPSCGHDLAGDLVGTQLPVRCPSCSRALCADKRGIWANFRLVLRNYAKFSGRATRAEFWGFWLANCLIYIVLYGFFIVPLIPIMGEQGGDLGLWILLLFATFALILLWSLYTLIPTLGVMARRLHDVGWSAKWLIPYFLLSTVAFVLQVMVYVDDFRAEGLDDTQVMMLGLLILATNVYAIFLLVLSLLDSKHGPNKYGPSSKYPLG